MTWIRDFKRDFWSTLYTKIFLFIGLASMIFLPGIAYWTHRPDIEDLDRFEATEFKDKTVMEIFDLPSRVGKGRRQTFKVSGDDYNSYPIYLESLEHKEQILVGSKISKEANSRKLTILTGDIVFTFQLADMRRSRTIAMFIFFGMAFVWTLAIVTMAYSRERAAGGYMSD